MLTHSEPRLPSDSAPISSTRPSVTALPTAAKPIEIDLDGRWFKDKTGRLVLLDRTRVMRRLVAALVRRYVEAPGEIMTTADLFRAAWPSDDILPSHASIQGRVYMTLSRLRAFGLGEIIARARGGYRIAPDALLEVKSGSIAPPAPASEDALADVQQA